MLAELDWIKNIAHKIDEENKTLVRKFSTLKAQFDIQEKDKTLLLKELLSKKKENAVLKSQVEQYEKLLSEISQEMQDTSSKKMEHYKHKPNLPASLFEEISENVQNKRFENTITHLNKVILK